MNITLYKKLNNLFQEFSVLSQKSKGSLTANKAIQNFDLSKYLQVFCAIDTYFYLVTEVSSFKVIEVGGAVEQMVGYQREELLYKSYALFLKFHTVRDILKSLKGGTKYYKYLYQQPKKNRPFIKVNRTMNIICKNGQTKHALFQGIPILFDDEMKPIYILTIITDISSLQLIPTYTHYIIDASNEKQIKKIPIHEEELQKDRSKIISKSERRVLELMIQGCTSKQIAERLFLSEHTIKNHRKSMLQKTNCKNSTELVKLALTNHWI
ncbi:MAG: PAS and helix-turn-helix domain-containing protein [Flavobacteriales bacterium]|nr:PAS and helix-turn-helix domain-containing protein [Flavobacteriales bacterium]